MCGKTCRANSVAFRNSRRKCASTGTNDDVAAPGVLSDSRDREGAEASRSQGDGTNAISLLGFGLLFRVVGDCFWSFRGVVDVPSSSTSVQLVTFANTFTLRVEVCPKDKSATKTVRFSAAPRPWDRADCNAESHGSIAAPETEVVNQYSPRSSATYHVVRRAASILFPTNPLARPSAVTRSCSSRRSARFGAADFSQVARRGTRPGRKEVAFADGEDPPWGARTRSSDALYKGLRRHNASRSWNRHVALMWNSFTSNLSTALRKLRTILATPQERNSSEVFFPPTYVWRFKMSDCVTR